MGIFKKDINVNHRFIISLVVINFLILGLYYAYGIFVVKLIKDDIAHVYVKSNFLSLNITGTGVTGNNNLDGYHGFDITVPANSNNTFEASITNDANNERFYRLVHKSPVTGVMVYFDSENDYPNGDIGSGSTKTISFNINNTTNSSVTVSFVAQESETAYFDIELGYSFINSAPNFDHSGAGNISLINNMIPIYYDEGENGWKKANVNNNDSNNIWYDYAHFRWANVALIENVDNNITTYVNAAPGTLIPSNVISAYFVYIPEFKYYVISSDGSTRRERVNNVVFRGDSNTLFYSNMMCFDNYSSFYDSHLFSENCLASNTEDIDNVINGYEESVNPSDNFSHFIHKGSGKWISKFGATLRDGNVKVLPNQNMLSTDTSFIDIVFNLNIDTSFGISNQDVQTYVSTNTDWSAAVILATSEFGKIYNPMYQTDNNKVFTRVYNNSSTITGRSSNYTNSSNNLVFTDDSLATYNNLTNLSHTQNNIVYPVGYKGAGASTTGTIYGIYDMSGGLPTTVMAFVLKEDGTFPGGIDISYPGPIDGYSYIRYNGIVDSYDKAYYLSSFKYGDTIKENIKFYGEKGMWQGGTLILDNYGIIKRGGDKKYGSIFSAEIIKTDLTESNIITNPFITLTVN